MKTEQDIWELLEIAPEVPEIKPGKENVQRHVAIRAGIMLAVIIFILLDVGLGWNIGEHGSYAGLGAIFCGLIFFGLWLVFLLIESIVMHANQKPSLRNADLYTVLAGIITAGLVFAVVFGGN